jgi:hypothetical protein
MAAARDLVVIAGICTWVDDLDELERLVPAYSEWQRRLGRLIKYALSLTLQRSRGTRCTRRDLLSRFRVRMESHSGIPLEEVGVAVNAIFSRGP